MDILEFKTQYLDSVVLCLGYFDGIHLGHTSLIKRGRELADKTNSKLAVLIFIGGKNSDGDVFTYEERLIKLKALNVDVVIYQELNTEFKNTTPNDFLKSIVSCYNLKAVVSGEDFAFGKNASGNVKFLKDFMSQYNVRVDTVNLISQTDGSKISTSDIKTHLKNGDIVKANALLGSNYFIRERVIKGKQKGRELGFPTANMLLSKQKMKIKSGVYLTLSIIDGKLYSAITNVGCQPTFNGEEFVIESYFKDYNGDLYDKILSVYFVDRIRDIIPFKTEDELKEQLKKDLRLL